MFNPLAATLAARRTPAVAAFPQTAPARRLLSPAPALTWFRWYWAFLCTRPGALAALASCCCWGRCLPSLAASPSPLPGPASHSPPSVPSVLLEIRLIGGLKEIYRTRLVGRKILDQEIWAMMPEVEEHLSVRRVI